MEIVSQTDVRALYKILELNNSLTRPVQKGARGDAVGWGTARQPGRSQVRFPMKSMGFFY